MLVSLGLTLLKFTSDCRCAGTLLNTCTNSLARLSHVFQDMFDCTAAFDSRYALVLGLPLTVYAAALYSTTLLLSLAAARGGPGAPRYVAWLFVTAVLDVLASLVLFAISSWVLEAWCLFCFCLYFISASLLAGASVSLHGLKRSPWTRANLRPALPACLLLLGAAIVGLQAAPYLSRCDRPEPGCWHDIPAPPETRLALGAADPDIIIAALIDPTCSACAREFVALQGLQQTDPGVALRFFQFPREPDGCGLPGARVPEPLIASANAHACDLSFAVECIAEHRGDAEALAALAITLKTRHTTPASAHLDLVVESFLTASLPRAALDRCIHARKTAVAERMSAHLRFGAALDVRSTPTLIVAPVVDGEPQWQIAQMLPGSGESRLRSAIERARAINH